MGLAAIRYYDLKQNRITNYKFDYNHILDSNGNTAVYLLYTYARICSILKKTKFTPDKLALALKKGGFQITHPLENILVLSLLRFPEIIDTVVAELNLHKLCDFVFNVALKICENYSKYRVKDDPDQEVRILLFKATKKIFDQAFYLLGIRPLKKI